MIPNGNNWDTTKGGIIYQHIKRKNSDTFHNDKISSTIELILQCNVITNIYFGTFVTVIFTHHCVYKGGDITTSWCIKLKCRQCLH